MSGDWWSKPWSVVSGCNWPLGQTPAGCLRCWARGMSKRFPAMHAGYRFNEVVCHPDRLSLPARTKRTQVFACSLVGDLFHPEVPRNFALDVFDESWRVNLFRSTPHWIVFLTKRYGRAVETCELWHQLTRQWPDRDRGHDEMILMCSVWDQASTDAACAACQELPAGFRWGLHVEPMIAAIDMRKAQPQTAARLPSWLVVGGETGPSARPMRREWVLALRDQCVVARVSFWLKSWGSLMEYGSPDMPEELAHRCDCSGVDHGTWIRASKKLTGRMLDGRTWDQAPW